MAHDPKRVKFRALLTVTPAPYKPQGYKPQGQPSPCEEAAQATSGLEYTGSSGQATQQPFLRGLTECERCCYHRSQGCLQTTEVTRGKFVSFLSREAPQGCNQKLPRAPVTGPITGWHLIEQAVRTQRSRAKPRHWDVSLIWPAYGVLNSIRK